MPEARVETMQLYGHMSSILTVSQPGSLAPEAKKMRQERPYREDLEGYVRITVNADNVYICIHCGCLKISIMFSRSPPIPSHQSQRESGNSMLLHKQEICVFEVDKMHIVHT